MHVLLIHQAFAALDEPGGTRHYELAHYLAGRGHQVTVIASPVSYLTGAARTDQAAIRGTPASPEFVGGGDGAGASKADVPEAGASGADVPESGAPEAGVTILRAYTYSAFHRSFLHRVFSFFSFMASSFWLGLRVRGVDLVWGTSPNIFQGVTAWALARLKRVPFLFEVRDLWPAFAVQVGVLRQPLLIGASEWLERFLYRHADRVIVNSPGFREHVQARGARRVELVPNGAEAAMFLPQADGAGFRRAFLGEQEAGGRFVALYAGAHGLSNDLGVILHAAELLRSRPEIALVLLGDGKEKPNLMRQAAEAGLENVYFLPPVPKTEMPQALAAADACIAILKPIPLYATVYPNKVFDYMAAGRPVVLAIDGVIREVVESSGAGIFTPPGDAPALAEALRRLADMPDRGRAMGWNGRRCVEAHFNRPQLARMLAEIVEAMGRATR